MEYLASCPLCQENRLSPFASCKDYTVTHETFDLQQCKTCGFVFTNPRPEEHNISRYYQSQAYISHANAAKGLLNRAYRIARTFTLKWKFTLVLKHSSIRPQTILDYGCGTGAFLQTCKQHGLTIEGVEPAPNARNSAQAITGAPIASQLSEIKNTFHAITLWHVLEHVYNLHQTLETLKKMLDENGTMFIAVPNLKSADAHYYKHQWAAYDVPRHLWHFSKEAMRKLLFQHNLRIKDVLPMPLDAYYVSLLSEKYKTEKQSLASTSSAILQGWKSNQQAEKTGEYSSLIYIVSK